MTRNTARTLLAALMALALVAAAAACGSDDDAAATDEDDGGQLQGLVRPEPLAVGEVALPDAESGELRNMVAAPGELLVVYFGYLSCPDVCPTTMADLKSAFAQLPPDDVAGIDVAFVTVDPDRDDGEQIDSYMDYFFERHRGLRPADMDQLAAAEEAFLSSSDRIPDDEGGYDVTHSAVTYVVDDTGTVLVEWAFGTSPEVMAADLAILLGDTTTT